MRSSNSRSNSRPTRTEEKLRWNGDTLFYRENEVIATLSSLDELPDGKRDLFESLLLEAIRSHPKLMELLEDITVGTEFYLDEGCAVKFGNTTLYEDYNGPCSLGAEFLERLVVLMNTDERLKELGREISENSQ